MDLGIAVDFGGRGLQDFRLAAFGETQHVDGAHNGGFCCGHGVELVVRRRCGAGEVINLIYLKKDRQGDVVTDDFEERIADEVFDVFLVAREKVVEADDVIALVDKTGTKMRPQKSGTAGDENAFPHERTLFSCICDAILAYGRFKVL